MKKSLTTIILSMFLLIWIISLSGAECVIQGYTQDSNNQLVGSRISGYCQNDNSWRNTTISAGELYQVSWGGPESNCQSYCNQVYLKAEHQSSIPEEPSLIGYTKNYPMNSGNTQGWNTGNTHWENMTLDNINKVKPKPAPIVKPSSTSQQKENQDKAIKSFNSVITQEYKKDKLNINKVKSIMSYGEEQVDISSSINEPFWITWWNILKRFFGIR